MSVRKKEEEKKRQNYFILNEKNTVCVIKVTNLIQCTCRRNFWYNYKYKIASISTSIQLLKYSGTRPYL